jgi:hypothetical protein
MKLAILFLAGAACLMPMAVGAQSRPVPPTENGPGCSGRCETQYGACHSSAEALLDECLDRAETVHQKAACAAAFAVREDKCRETESACLSNCPS